MASYSVNPEAVAHAEDLIRRRQYVLDSDWGEVQPDAEAENAFLERHPFEEYAAWHLGLTEGATEGTKARHAFVYGDLRRVHRTALIACVYRASEWRHKEVELAAHDLLQLLDQGSRPPAWAPTPGAGRWSARGSWGRCRRSPTWSLRTAAR